MMKQRKQDKSYVEEAIEESDRIIANIDWLNRPNSLYDPSQAPQRSILSVTVDSSCTKNNVE
jgi:hypothetical protein